VRGAERRLRPSLPPRTAGRAGRLITVNRVRVRDRGSGIKVIATGAQLWTIKESKAARMKLYQSKTEALEAAGLRE
jgi:hypothetical protein